MKRVLWLLAVSALPAHAQSVSTANNELARDAAVVTDPAITAYVNRLAGKLAQTAALRAPLTIKVISGSNAYTTVLPGGVLDVDSTLILDAMSEAEVAGVIAHQIAHLALLPSIETGGQCVRCGLHSLCTAPAIPMAFLATSRDREGKADELALGYMQNAGYDPRALADFYGRIAKAQRGAVARVFDVGLLMPESTRVEAESMRNARSLIVTSSDFEDIQSRVAALLRSSVPRTRVPSLNRSGR